jgi:chemotaxis protein methyltransferase CheR
MAMLPMSAPVFAILSGFIEEKVGLHFGPDKADLVVDRVATRALECGFTSPLDYYYFLRYDDPGEVELQTLVASLVVHETFFFREFDQLELAATLLEARARTGVVPRVWSTACATGEEPLTLAMLLDERGLLRKVEVVATDLSERALARARGGTFPQRSLRAVPRPKLVDRWVRAKDDRLAVDPDLVDSIHWERLNLLDEAGVAALGTFDVILCRNVLIYFRDDTAKKVVQSLARRLEPEGALFVGVSESLLRFETSLRCEERAGAFFYRKAE